MNLCDFGQALQPDSSAREMLPPLVCKTLHDLTHMYIYIYIYSQRHTHIIGLGFRVRNMEI